MPNILTYLASNYPDFRTRSQIEELNLANKNLTGELDFTSLGFTNLKKINLGQNKLTKINLINPEQITYLDVSDNQLTFLNTSQLENLTFGQIKNNSLPQITKKD
jgi:Leucine-rich repeat (LRR) protein